MQQVAHDVATEGAGRASRADLRCEPRRRLRLARRGALDLQRALRVPVRVRGTRRAEQHAAPAPTPGPRGRPALLLVALLGTVSSHTRSRHVPVPWLAEGRDDDPGRVRHDPAVIRRAHVRVPLRARPALRSVSPATPRRRAGHPAVPRAPSRRRGGRSRR